jgi:type VI secretion system protein ImpC
VTRTETSKTLKIKVIDATKQELLEDFRSESSLRRTHCFRELNTDQFEVVRREPYGVLIGDYQFCAESDDIELLQNISAVAAQCNAPFIAAASPEMFGLLDFEGLQLSYDLDSMFSEPRFATWQQFRRSETSLYVALTLPRMLLRLPYDRSPALGVNSQYAESAPEKRCLLWGNAAYGLATCLTRAFAEQSWPASIRGVDGGGLVDSLPAWPVGKKLGGASRGATEILITEQLELMLADQGFIPVVSCKGSAFAAFFSVPCCHQQPPADSKAAPTKQIPSCQLSYVLAVSRFMHFIKAVARESKGKYSTRDELERFLMRWISSYVDADDDATLATRARFPLREARIEVT